MGWVEWGRKAVSGNETQDVWHSVPGEGPGMSAEDALRTPGARYRADLMGTRSPKPPQALPFCAQF